MRETDVVRSITTFLALSNIYVRRCNVGMIPNGRGGFRRSTMVGMSDLIGVLPGGRFLAIEAKVPGGKVTVEQQAFLDRVNESGGLAMVATSAQDVRQKLAAEGVVTRMEVA